MQATLEIVVLSILTLGLLLGFYKVLTGGANHSGKLSTCAVMVFGWFMISPVAIGLVSLDRPASFPLLPVWIVALGMITAAGLGLAACVATLLAIGRDGRALRLSGSPTEPGLLPPWVWAVITGIITFVLAMAAILFGYYVLLQQELLQGAQQRLSPGVDGAVGTTEDLPVLMNWVVGTLFVVVVVAYGVQWLRYRKAWKEYHELRIGTDHLREALKAAQHDNENA